MMQPDIKVTKISKRSSRACAACRCRKVKCDVVAKGAPCTTCRFQNVACSVPVDRRGKKVKAAEKDVEGELVPTHNDHVVPYHISKFAGKLLRSLKLYCNVR